MKRHSFDMISFLFGALFLGAALSAVLIDGPLDAIDGRFVWPVVFIVTGVAVLAVTIRGRGQDLTADGDSEADQL